MSWDRTYSHNVLYGIDCLGAILFWNQPDITISSLCRIVQLADQDTAYGEWRTKLITLNLYVWQEWILRKLAPILDWIQTAHCEGARQADIARGNRTLALLQPTPGSSK